MPARDPHRPISGDVPNILYIASDSHIYHWLYQIYVYVAILDQFMYISIIGFKGLDFPLLLSLSLFVSGS